MGRRRRKGRRQTMREDHRRERGEGKGREGVRGGGEGRGGMEK